ncbi:MJ0042-type zinc finger domain-containing protein, partial [Pseudomonas taiwanensis]
MTDSFVTQCPHCQTSFRVTHHQLSVARGVVRCGHCLQVFNAAKQLLEQNRAGGASAPAVPAPMPAAPAEPLAEPVIAPEPVASESGTTPDEDWALTSQALDALDLDMELERL